MYFQKPGRKPEKTWKKFRKPGENFQKSFGQPVRDLAVTIVIFNSFVILIIYILMILLEYWNELLPSSW